MHLVRPTNKNQRQRLETTTYSEYHLQNLLSIEFTQAMVGQQSSQQSVFEIEACFPRKKIHILNYAWTILW